MSLRKNVDTWLRRFEKDFATYNHILVSKSALVHNLRLFEKLSGAQVIPVLKGNAYGHGLELVAQALRGQKLPYVAVDGYFEALRIREVSRQPVLVMGAILPQNYARMKYNNFSFVVHEPESIDALGRTGKRIQVHLECNTGMNRYGAKPSDVAALAKRIADYPNLQLEGVMSHLADSDGTDPATVDVAVEQFDACVDAVRATGARPTMLHVAQSAGSVKAKSAYANAVRLGIGLYGINPFEHGHTKHTRLRALHPALSLTSTISKVIELQKGDRVSYNYTFTAPKAMRIGVLPLGYYEGLNRSLSNVGEVKLGNAYTPITGRVCMNHTVISLAHSRAKVGDSVLIYSSNPHDRNSINHIAHKHHLFTYNLLTALSPDVRRILVD